MATRRQQFCGDTLNIFGREDQNFQWSRSYWYYATFPLPGRNENKIWTSGISLVGCVPEVFDCKEIVSWCTDKLFQDEGLFNFKENSPFL
jgi:hypothetical protein